MHWAASQADEDELNACRSGWRARDHVEEVDVIDRVPEHAPDAEW